MLEMRFSPPISAISLMGCLMGALSVGCATTAGSANHDRVVVAVDPQVQSSSEVMEVTEIVPPVAAPDPQVRRRLSQTVTLGQGTSEPVYAAAAPQQGQGQGGNSQSVTVNNNVTIMQQPPAYYGGYGYGSYGGFGRGAASTGRDGTSRGNPTTQAWAPNGWEGAGRTAAPGRTPGVGGNFSPAPSFGPRSMK
jgi:hypothetical protein